MRIDIQTDADRQTGWCGQTNGLIQTDKWADGNRHTDRHADRHMYTHTDMRTDTQIGRQTCGQTQTDVEGQTCRQTHRHANRHTRTDTDIWKRIKVWLVINLSVSMANIAQYRWPQQRSKLGHLLSVPLEGTKKIFFIKFAYHPLARSVFSYPLRFHNEKLILVVSRKKFVTPLFFAQFLVEFYAAEMLLQLQQRLLQKIHFHTIPSVWSHETDRQKTKTLVKHPLSLIKY